MATRNKSVNEDLFSFRDNECDTASLKGRGRDKRSKP